MGEIRKFGRLVKFFFDPIFTYCRVDRKLQGGMCEFRYGIMVTT